MVVVTFFALWLAVFFDENIEAVLSYTLIFSFGMLHGSNDIKIINTISKNKGLKFYRYAILLVYVAVIGLMFLLFYLFPDLALLVFIAISGFHFGEQHWKKKTKVNSFWNPFFYTTYGLCILFMIFYIKSEQVILIINDISSFELRRSFLYHGFLITTLGSIVFIGVYTYLGWLQFHAVEELFLLIVFYVVFYTASLLWGFCVYFVIWHSIPSLMDQTWFLFGKVDKASLWRYVRYSWVYWLLSIFGLLMLYFLLRGNNQFFISILLYFLAAVTFPHVLVMSFIDED